MTNAVIYTLPTCPKCKILKTKLSRAGIKYTECQDIETMKSLGIQSTPAFQFEKNGTSRLIKDFGEINTVVNELLRDVERD